MKAIKSSRGDISDIPMEIPGVGKFAEYKGTAGNKEGVLQSI
jgi:hypothetical protein